MSRRSTALAACLCALVLIAGCTAPVKQAGGGAGATTTAPTTTDDATPDAPVDVVGGSLSFDANETFRGVAAVLGTDYRGARVVVRDLSAYKSGDVQRVPFFRLLGVQNPRLDVERPSGLTTTDGTVYLSPASGSSALVEQTLAHEFVHVAQVRQEMVPWFTGFSLERVTLDERFARRALVEGGAVYAADAYTRERLPDRRLQSARIAAQYEAASPANRLVLAQYHFGYRYVNATIDDPAALGAVYEDGPRTTENVLHPGDREPPVALNVSADARNFTREESATGRVGELVSRVVLQRVASPDRAAAAAAGWGNDEVLLFAREGSQSLAWVTRWDSPRDADEFGAVARTFSAPDAEHAYRTVRAGDSTVVLLAGTERFVGAAAVNASAGDVTVTA